MKNGMQDRIETILSSLDQAQRASAPEYLYTRIRGRMQEKEVATSTYWILRPVPLIVVLTTFLFINAGLIWNQKIGTSEMTKATEITPSAEASTSFETEVPSAVAAEYRLHDNVTFYDNGREISSR
jgi:hypothetical protein